MGAIDGYILRRSAKIVGQTISPWYRPVKRLMDVSISTLMLIVALPVLIPSAVAILLDSGWPIFHKRTVVGLGGKAFEAFKLRTMSEEDAPILDHGGLSEEYKNNHKLKEDPRVTRVGKLLRKASIDELPQLLNVLKGEMSLVGPRMISFPELEKFGEWQDKILEVKPGITGLWQVSGRSDLDYEDRVRLNVYYVDKRSVMLDLKILAKTIPAVLSGKGAY
jgi:lipopolysaccharide/colanic/teichoic acid biosynthesis glycosyltransferase